MLRFKRPSAATTIAFVALFVVLGGSAVAAKMITGKDIKNGTIGTVDLSSKAKRSLKGNAGPRGPQGIAGALGAQGPQGPAGPSVVGKLVYVDRSFVVVAGDTDVQGVACPASHSIVSGGFTIFGIDAVPFVNTSYSGAEWSLGVDNYNSTVSALATAYARCAPTGRAVVASKLSVNSQRARAERMQRAARATQK